MKTLGKAFEPEIAEGHNVVVFVRSGVVRVGAEGLVRSPFYHVITFCMCASQWARGGEGTLAPSCRVP
jgi:hypothetical protein